MKTTDLTLHALDWAVAKAEGFDAQAYEVRRQRVLNHCDDAQPKRYSPSTDWAQGGPIIEREGISVQQFDGSGPKHRLWNAYIGSPPLRSEEEINGPTPLVAAMRCYVASLLGDEVEIPGELL